DQAPVADRGHAPDPEEELLLADSVGLALLVVLDTLEPAERLAFVLHDMFDLSFDEIAPIVGRSTAAARQLASRARRRVRGAAAVPDIARQREVVGAFLAAARGGDFEALVSVLDPDVVFRPDPALRGGPSAEVRGAQAVAKLFSGRAQAAHAALVNGAVGVVVAPRGRLFLVLGLKISAGKISEVEVIADPARLRRLDLAVLDG
ncbi:MAG TPA: sigma factor-like helix-turn-helix DNA-binding protein, partial [Acidobacteriaceae bacterium]